MKPLSIDQKLKLKAWGFFAAFSVLYKIDIIRISFQEAAFCFHVHQLNI